MVVTMDYQKKTARPDKIPDIAYRPCRKSDLGKALRLIIRSLNHLRPSTGKKPIRPRWNGIPPGWLHLFAIDKKLFWTAWHSKKLVGFAAALIRDKQWYLSYLFVHPRYQKQKVGRKLLEKVWRDGPGFSHSLATFAFNMQAVGLYSQYGLVPISGLPMMIGKRSQLKPVLDDGLILKKSARREDLIWINVLGKKVRGYQRPHEWEFWKKQNDVTINVFYDGRKRVGYNVVFDDGLIGPAGAVSNDYLERVIISTIKSCSPKKSREYRLWCPSANMRLYRSLIKIGFRCQEMELFMSDKDYADFSRYVPAPLAIF